VTTVALDFPGLLLGRNANEEDVSAAAPRDLESAIARAGRVSGCVAEELRHLRNRRAKLLTEEMIELGGRAAARRSGWES